LIKNTDLIFSVRKKSSNKLNFIWAFLFLTAPAIIMGQSGTQDEGFVISLFHKGNAFWHRSNQLGISSDDQFFSASIQSPQWQSFRYSFRIVNAFSGKNKVILPIGYINKPIGDYELIIGRWRKNISSESNLSTGSLIRGNNALPIPQVSFQLPKYKQFKFLNYNFWIKAGLSHGWFSNESYIRSPFLHEKYLYLKIPIKSNSSFSVGLVHEAMWGGETQKHGKQPQTLTDFIYVVTGQPASNSGYEGEQVNTLGNHLGIWDLSYSKETQSRIYRIYFQHPFEDKSGMYQYFLDELKKRVLTTKSFDGLVGFEIKNKSNGIIATFLYEYLNTMFQSGAEPSKPGLSYGWDSYYNHYIYESGWINHGRNIGNALFINGRIIENGDNIINNRITAHHIGISGNIMKSISHQILLTTSKNYGSYWDSHLHKSNNKPYKFSGGVKQFSGLFQINIQKLWTNVNVQFSYAFDRGDLHPDSDSFLFSISYQFSNLSPSH